MALTANNSAPLRRVQALEAFGEQMQRRDEEIDVLECALLIAKHAHPDLVRMLMASCDKIECDVSVRSGTSASCCILKPEAHTRSHVHAVSPGSCLLQ